jgi:hypothetical protein
VDDIVCVKKLKDGTSSDQAYHEVSALQQVQTLGSHPVRHTHTYNTIPTRCSHCSV